MPIDASVYPSDWKLRSRFVRFYRAKNRCEWCGAKNRRPHPVTGSRVVLTTAHVYDKRPHVANLLNLAALCQRCHLRHDAKDKAEARARKRREREAQQDMFSKPETAREFVHRRVRDHKRMPQYILAKRMGLTGPALCRKLHQYPNDGMKFTLDDFERYVETTGDTKPIEYLIEKYLAGERGEIERLRARLAELEAK